MTTRAELLLGSAQIAEVHYRDTFGTDRIEAMRDAAGRIQRLEFALDLICSLEQPIGHNDTDLMQAQSIAAEALIGRS